MLEFFILTTITHGLLYMDLLTVKAESMVSEIEAIAQKVTKKALAGFSNMEEQQMFRSLNIIIANLSEEVQ